MFIALTIALLLILGLVSALLTAMETAILTVLEHEREALSARVRTPVQARAIQLLKDNPERSFDQILLVGSIVNLMLAVTVLITVRHSPFGINFIPAALVFFVLILIGAEILPKAYALNRPRSVLLRTAPLLIRIDAAGRLLTARLIRLCDRVVELLTPDSLRPNPSLKEEELDTLVEMRQEEGTLDHEEGDVIREILRLSNRTAKDCMTPRTDTQILPDDLSYTDADTAIRAQNHWNIPVFQGQPDSIVGVLDVHAYLDDESANPDYMKHLRPPVFVPESMNALKLFDEHFTDSFSIVVVLDEYGGFEGVVTATDMLEELIGDAAPSNFSEVEIQEVTDGRYIVSGGARLDELGDLFDLDLSHEGLDTIGGLIFTLAGEVPTRGRTFSISDGIRATVRMSTKTRVKELIIERIFQDKEERQ